MIRKSLLLAGVAALAACQSSGPSRISGTQELSIECVTGCIQPLISVTPDGDTVIATINSNRDLAFVTKNNSGTGTEVHFNQCSTTGAVTCTNLDPDSVYVAAGGTYDGPTASIHVGTSGGTVTVGAIAIVSGHIRKDTGSYTIVVP